MIRLRFLAGGLLATAISATLSTGNGQVLANPLFDDTKVQIINLTVNPADWATLQRDYLLNTYYHATVAWNGVSMGAGIKSRGTGSRSPVKPNLDVDFQHYDKTNSFLGLSWLVLKANNQDPSNLREWISMKLFRRMGIPAPREAPAQVFLNGDLLGFYFIVEQVNETMLMRVYGENGGYLYKWSATDGYGFEDLGTDPSVYSKFLDLKTKQPAPDLQTFTNFVQVINQPATDTDFIRALSAYIDPRAFLGYCATAQALADSDGITGGVVGMNNFFLYQMQGTTHYELIPWDKDNSFTVSDWDALAGITFEPSINRLAQRLYGIPAYKQAYLNSLAKATALLNKTGGWADQEISREYGVIAEAARNDPHKQCLGNEITSCGVPEFESTVNWLHDFLRLRYDYVMAEANSLGMEPLTGLPQIAESGIWAAGGFETVSPGALVNIDGAEFGPEAQASALPLPRVLGDRFVAVEGVRVPLIAASPGNIRVAIPGDISAGTASVVVSSGGLASNTADVVVAAATPLIIGVVHQDGSNVTLANPPIPGEALSIYAVGLGAVGANLNAGVASPFNPLAVTAAMPEIVLGVVAAPVLWSGLTPGYVGLYQVNILVPSNLPYLATGCTLRIADASSWWQYPDQ